MRKGKGMRVVLAIFVLVLAVFTVPLLAQEKPADDMQIVRDKIRADKKLFVSENMKLTESEAKAFWPIYDAYQKDLGKLWDRSFKVIEEYAKNYESMTNEAAKKLVDEYIAIEAARQNLRTSYLPKFRKAVPEKKVARYYQLENKIHAAVSYEMATKIPLVK
jgi:soluble lytic murein transglycosylase-like protein